MIIAKDSTEKLGNSKYQASLKVVEIVVYRSLLLLLAIRKHLFDFTDGIEGGDEHYNTS